MEKELLKLAAGILNASSISLPEDVISRLVSFTRLLLESKVNVISRHLSGFEELFQNHILDSLHGLKLVEKHSIKDIADLGTGGGIPGLVLKIARKDIILHLIDSNHKKILFTEYAARELGLGGVEFLNAHSSELLSRKRLFPAMTVKGVSMEEAGRDIIGLTEPGGFILSWTTGKKLSEDSALPERAKPIDSFSYGLDKKIIVYKCFI